MKPLLFLCLKQKVKLITRPSSSETTLHRAKVSFDMVRDERV
jgi:hypothetical protein